jgi:hypothetical protein
VHYTYSKTDYAQCTWIHSTGSYANTVQYNQTCIKRSPLGQTKSGLYKTGLTTLYILYSVADTTMHSQLQACTMWSPLLSVADTTMHSQACPCGHLY